MLDSAPRHSRAFRVRRFLNWFPLGLAYAFMYMGRYNLTVAKNALGELLTKADFGTIIGVGAIVYGCAAVVNGPLTDRVGGRRIMLIGVAGTLVTNAVMGLALYGIVRWHWQLPIAGAFLVLYTLNMYFQSFGAMAIVTVKAPWFHLRERGTFSTIFGVMISLGVYFAFDWGGAIVQATRGTLKPVLDPAARIVRWAIGTGGTGVDQNWWLFFIPSALLAVLWVVLFKYLRNAPADAGFANFSTGEGSVSQDGERLPISVIFFKILRHPVLVVICGIAIANGVMKNGIMTWYPIYAKETGLADKFFVSHNWGLVMLIAGVVGSVLTGWASDRFFGSRRAPMACILYGAMVAATLLMTFGLGGDPWLVGSGVIVISASFIGVHGIMSGTSTMDFGGSKNTGSAVGIVDGLVYLGTAVQSLSAAHMTPSGEAATDAQNWTGWTGFLIPFAVIGFVLAARIWNALPNKARAAAPEKAAAMEPGAEPDAA